MRKEEKQYLTPDRLSEFITKERISFYESLPYFIENHTPYKILPYAYAKEFIDLINASLKSLKESITNFSFPYEEKSKKYDYALAITPLIGLEAKFLNRLFYYDNLLDKRCIERWFATSGRQFTRTLKDVLIKTAKEFGNEKPAVFLYLLTLLQDFNSKKLEFSSINLGKVVPERKELYFSNLFFFLLKLILDLYIEDVKDEKALLALKADFISPLIFYDNRFIFLRNPFNWWHLTKNLFDVLETNKLFNKSFSEENSIPREVYNEALFAAKVKDVRKVMYDFIVNNYVEDEFMVNLVSVYYTPAYFFNFFKDDDYRNRLFNLKKHSKLYQLRDKREQINSFQENIENVLKPYSKETNTVAVFDILTHYFRYKNQEAFAFHVKSMLLGLRDRRGDASIDLKKEYEEGKLYYFSTEGTPIIKRAEKQTSAAVFIDIREFSKKTFHLKEEAVIELLKEKFYLPVLRYAATRKDTGSLRLANIVGDAMVFLGPVDEVVKLSLQVKKHLNDYKKGLEHLIEDAEKKELMTLDIGIFISFGKNPVVTTVNSEFGVNTFAIGEIINEASRGSRRDVNAFNRIQYMLTAEAKKRGKELKLPFEVNIVEGYELSMPPTIEFNLLKLETEGDINDAMKQFFEQAKTEMFLKTELSQKIWSKRKYIYNIGIGLSEEAVNAFIDSQKLFSDIKKVKISCESFSGEIRNKFFFRNKDFEFVYIKNRKTGEAYIFRKEASIKFRGFYQDTEVWELLTEQLEIYPQVLSLLR